MGAMTILTSVMQFAMLPLQGLGQGAQPIISYNYGARNCRKGKGSFLGCCLKNECFICGGIMGARHDFFLSYSPLCLPQTLS